MPSKKRKYNARFPAGRIKKIMQTDEEVGKVAQAVPIIISRTLELFVESLLTKAMQVTTSRNAKTLSPSHVKQCILAEARFDFLKDLVKNIPDVSVAEEKEMMSAENSPNSSRFADMSIPPRRLAREDSNTSSSSEALESTKRSHPHTLDLDASPNKYKRTAPSCSSDSAAIDLSVKSDSRTANFYQEVKYTEESTRSVITINPTYSAQPSTSSSCVSITTQQIPKLEKLKSFKQNYIDTQNAKPVTPVLNIDFTNLVPKIEVLDEKMSKEKKLPISRQNSRQKKEELRPVSRPIDVDHLNSALEIDEDYDT